MIRFIALTETPSNRKILINVASIVYVTKGRKEDTYIRVNAGTGEEDAKSRNFYFFVKEPVDEIQKMLLTDNTQPPVMMSAAEFEAYQGQLHRALCGDLEVRLGS